MSYTFIIHKKRSGWEAECLELGCEAFGKTFHQAIMQLTSDVSWEMNNELGDDEEDDEE